MIKNAFNITLILVLCILAVSAQGKVSCELAAFVNDPSSGVNVRSGPGLNNRILKTIPRDQGGTLVLIAGASGDWLKISSAVNSNRVRVFSGTGWVHAPLLSVKTRGGGDETVPFYRNPRTETESIGSIRPELDVNVMGCSGDWIKVLIPQRGTEAIPAWLPFGSFCGSPWEDCD